MVMGQIGGVWRLPVKIHEFQAKQLLAHYGIAVPASGGVIADASEARAAAEAVGGRCVLKAQVHVGGRGKAGGIRVVANADEAEQAAGEMLGMLLRTRQAADGVRVSRLLVEEPLNIEQELYLGVVPDRTSQRNVIMLSMMGGMDIEAVADEHPDAIARVRVDPLLGLRPYQLRGLCGDAGVPREIAPAVATFAEQLYAAYYALDASLAEINPLAITRDGRVLAADAKLVVDDNALFRHPDLRALQDDAEEDPIEAEAHRRSVQYVRLGGDIGILGNGAGLVMATLDEVARAGGRPANFLDIGGGAKAELVRSALEIVLSDPNVRAVLFNVFGGITRGDEVARGIIESTRTLDIRVPVVVRLAGTRAAEGAEILRDTPLTFASGMAEAARKVVELAAAS